MRQTKSAPGGQWQIRTGRYQGRASSHSISLSKVKSSPKGLNEDFNISAARELSVRDIARIVWESCGEDPAAFELEHLPSFTVDVQRRWPSVEKARKLLGWRARVDVEEGIADTVRWLRERHAPPEARVLAER